MAMEVLVKCVVGVWKWHGGLMSKCERNVLRPFVNSKGVWVSLVCWNRVDP